MKKIISLFAISLFAFTGLAMAQQKDSIPPAPYGLSPLEAYSIFSESYKNNDYETALPYGRWLIIAHPKKLPQLPQYDGPSVFSRMIDIYSSYAKKQSDPTLKTAYYDSALALYNDVFKIFDSKDIDSFDWYIQRGRFYQSHSDFLQSGIDSANANYMKDFQLDPKRLTQIGKGYYVQLIVNYLVSKGDKDKATAVMKKAQPFANQETKEYFGKVSNQIYSTPTERITYLKSKIASNPSDTASMDELYNLYHQQQDINRANAMAQKLYKMNPNFENARRLGNIASDNANYKDAIKYYKEALDKAKTVAQKKQVVLGISENYINLDELPEARDYARLGMKIDPKWGQPYLKMAKIYAQAVNDCGGANMTRLDKVVYWLVLDYLDKAKRVDPSTASTVEQQYKIYKQATPTVEEKFYENWHKGQKIKIDSTFKKCYGWINETTTVR